MSVTAQQVLNVVYALGDELDSNGQATNTTDMEVRTPYILTALQSELIKNGDLYRTYEISRKPVVNKLGNGFRYLEHINEDVIVECEGTAQYYTFEVDRNCTVYVEDFTSGWNIKNTIEAEEGIGGYLSSFDSFGGVITPTPGATKTRIRFTGNFRYLITNFALFDAPFDTSNFPAPTYAPWVKYEMPSDFKSVDQIIEEYSDRQYSKSSNYKWEGRKDLYINYDFEGKIRIIYRPVPTAITALTDSLTIDDVTALSVLPWGLAMELYKYDESKYEHFKQRYLEMKSLSMIKQPASEQSIVNVY